MTFNFANAEQKASSRLGLRPRTPLGFAQVLCRLALLWISLFTLFSNRELMADDRLVVPQFRSPAEVRALPEGWVEKRSGHFIFQAPSELAGNIPGLQADAEVQRVELMDQLDPSTLMQGLHKGAFTPVSESAQAAPKTSTAQALPVSLYVVRLTHTEEQFHLAQPGQPPTWAAGVAYPAFDLMVLRLDRARAPFGEGSVSTVFRHELVHLILGDLFGERMPPRWFDEGLARMLAREASIEQWVLLSQAVVAHRLFPFSTLEKRFPTTSTGAELAYAQSREFLNYLLQQFGPSVLPGLIASMREGENLNEALWTRTGYGLKNLEDQWLDHLESNFAWISALGGGMTLLWGVGGILLFLGFLRRREQRKIRHERWALEEALEYGPSSPEELEALMKAAKLGLIPGGLSAVELGRAFGQLNGKLQGTGGTVTVTSNAAASPTPSVNATEGSATHPSPNLIERTRPTTLDDEPPLAVYNGRRVRPDRPIIPNPGDEDMLWDDELEDEEDGAESDNPWSAEEIQHFEAIDFQLGLGEEGEDELDPDDRPPPGGWLH